MNSSINSIGSQIVDNNEAKFHAGLYYWILTEMTDWNDGVWGITGREIISKHLLSPGSC